jgi:hypothetical protein
MIHAYQEALARIGKALEAGDGPGLEEEFRRAQELRKRLYTIQK